MKFLKIFTTVIIVALLFNSCQKELYFDLSGQSEGSLKSDATSNNCLPSTINGVYKVNTATNADNYIEVQVDVSVVGLYSIVSDTLNGYSFSGNGVFETSGIHTVRLYSSGTPLTEGVNSFTIFYNDSHCVLDVEVQPEITNPAATYTLGGAGGSCTGVLLAGSYSAGVPLTSSNTITINVGVTSPGTFSISTNTMNGVSFSASGNLSVSNSTITLTGSGTPSAAGAFYFTVNAGSQTCTFSVTFDQGPNPAVYTFGGAPNDCTGAILMGEYSVGNPTTLTHTATITVNVTAVGSYTISSQTVNGISFFANGEFSVIGVQQVILIASGTPLSAGTFNYTVTGGGSTCTFSVPFVNNFITCNIDGSFTTFNISATALLENSTGFPHLSIDGSTNSSSADPSISLQIFKSNGGTITAGTYTVNQASSGIAVSCDYNDASSANFYNATDPNNQAQNPGITIVITSISASRCIGTFSGVVYENSGLGPNFKVIDNGTFDVPVR